jgi:hypothetical protein
MLPRESQDRQIKCVCVVNVFFAKVFDMTQEQLRHGQVHLGPSGDADEFSDTATSHGGNVQVIHGVHAHSMPISGMTIRQARAELEERLNLAPDALAVVDGNEADEDTVLTENQVLNFVKHAGEKGARGIATYRGHRLFPSRDGMATL